MCMKKRFLPVFGAALLTAVLAGCGRPAGGDISAAGMAFVRFADPPLYIIDEGSLTESEGPFEEPFKPYEQFGLRYDAGKDELQYNGRVVRWFEDYYAVGENIRVGRDHFSENGVVDVYAVRDLSRVARFEDGSFDPGGVLVGLREFTAEEFAARDIEAIKNPPPAAALAGDPPTMQELEEIAGEYAAFGVAYNAKEDQWYLNGEKIRFFRDVLTSNGESLTGGGFHGTLRTFWNDGGTVDVYTVRDYANPNSAGNSTLISVERFSQEEFDERTRASRQEQASSGECVVLQE